MLIFKVKFISTLAELRPEQNFANSLIQTWLSSPLLSERNNSKELQTADFPAA